MEKKGKRNKSVKTGRTTKRIEETQKNEKKKRTLGKELARESKPDRDRGKKDIQTVGNTNISGIWGFVSTYTVDSTSDRLTFFYPEDKSQLFF